MQAMEMTGTPWLDMPLRLESSRAYHCKFNDTALCTYQTGYWRFWYEADHRFGLSTVALFMTGIVLFAIFNLVSEFTPRGARQTRVVRQVQAASRWLSYRSWRIERLNWNSAPAGVLFLGAVGTIFFFAMTLGPKPYYWPNTATIKFGNSPPIATRSGWMSIACMPFVFLTTGKSNLITFATGVSHEKLQVFHRWISYAMYITALIHTFPFIVYNIQQGTMTMQWNTSIFYWTGVVALVAQTWLTFASFGPIRNIGYEFFKYTHFLAGLVFILFLFFHCDAELTSWHYFIATGAVFATSFIHRHLRIYFEHGFGHKATVNIDANGFLRVVIPTTASWRAGQHFFVRFMTPDIHALTTHPFTACSLPARSRPSSSEDSELVLFIRPRKGMTARLARRAEANPGYQVRVLLDGPYGGIDMQRLAACGRTVVVTGGSGAGFALPLITAFLRKAQWQTIEQQQKLSLRVILATRDAPTRGWFESAVAQEIATFGASETAARNIRIEVYYTGSAPIDNVSKADGQFLRHMDDPEKAQQIVSVETDSDSQTSGEDNLKVRSTTSVDHTSARPDLPSIMAAEGEAARGGDTLGVFVCGPLSMQNDVSTAVARRQWDIVRNGSGDVYLHMEHFSWA